MGGIERVEVNEEHDGEVDEEEEGVERREGGSCHSSDQEKISEIQDSSTTTVNCVSVEVDVGNMETRTGE